ncbi:MAG: hypothetical protein E5V49_02290 [Mesorhizobium sp.]|nr:hypothetical protein EN848_06020 [bacterium M00.F.Ca.ET.205.01.1.1]TGU53636.1 hypothetical protein EN795_10435 [bacterium M00.F.Ca.ET.152.01.1.1]TGV37134.1 hypothetical protein EN829_010460 [Mesorhizobium sp. M00.F.Ca.ET.186.01.1.1]TGZ41437.1 hypothetical protein EN805_17990 [bacterium M00.F.Ca.ET.162.01.1.1]TIW61243.1 MAG: hypothetical protein E5V48_10180 [Mesorhizobium sp.]
MPHAPVVKKDQERITYAWMCGVHARKDGRERAVPPFWRGLAAGLRRRSNRRALKPLADTMEAEVDEAAIMEGL